MRERLHTTILMPSPMPAPPMHEWPECPSEELLIAIASGEHTEVAATVTAHAQSCTSCSVLLAGLSDTASDVARSADPIDTREASEDAQFVAEFRLLRPLGQGTMGEVFLARDTFLDRLVAIKFISRDNSSISAKERFYVEARAVARLQHPNVVTLYRAGEERGRSYLVSEFVRGQSLERQQTPLPWTQVLEIGLGLARGLASAHERGVLHRDIKPANVMVTKDREIKILDFGLAKLLEVLPKKASALASGGPAALPLSATQPEVLKAPDLSLTKTGSLLGTPLYMAPESWKGEPATAQTDVYSVGALLYELCTGHPPHYADTAAALRFRVVSVDASPLVSTPAIDQNLALVIDRCLQRDASKRFASGAELRDALERIAVKSTSLPGRIIIVALSIFFFGLLLIGIFALTRDRQDKKRAELAQRLGEQIATMEWLLRSARQLPPHALEYEKSIVRKRMSQIQSELAPYGTPGKGLAHYALGRGHMALHEYPEALSQLRLAIQHGSQSAELHYALGLVLGKHFEQAMEESRLSGGSDWAKRQLRELEPVFLLPAIESLERSRGGKVEAPQYLEGLIAFYRRNQEVAIQKADEALREAPWLYEAHKLAGDAHLALALQARDIGRMEEAERRLAAAIKRYSEATAIGQSDAEVYESLAESWIVQSETSSLRGKPTDKGVFAAFEASDKSSIVEPDRIGGLLKKARAASQPTAAYGIGMVKPDLIRQCLSSAAAVLARQPENPYARDISATCHIAAAEIAKNNGEDPIPILRKALSILQQAVEKHPRFLWGINDLGVTYAILGMHLQRAGHRDAKETLEKSISYFDAAASLDPTFTNAVANPIFILGYLIDYTQTDKDLDELLARADFLFDRCRTLNPKYPLCFSNHLQVHTLAAQRSLLADQDPQPRLQRALVSLEEARRLGGRMMDAEQYAALMHWVVATNKVRHQQDPSDTLRAMHEDLDHCFTINAKDAMCRTLAAQADWVAAEWLAAQRKPWMPSLERSKVKAALATSSPEPYPDAFYVLAETHLRLARSAKDRASLQEAHIRQGLAACDRLFALNANHARGLATHGELHLLRAQATSSVSLRHSAARSAVHELTRALHQAPFLSSTYGPLLTTAQALTL